MKEKLSKETLLKEITSLINEEVICNDCKINGIIDALNDYKSISKDNPCPICRINNIWDSPTELLTEEDCFFMLDVMEEILMHYGILSEYSRIGCEEEIDITGYHDDCLDDTAEKIIRKLNDLFLENYMKNNM